MAVFTIRIFKSAGARSDRGQFSNSYDVDLATDLVTAPEVNAIVQGLVDCERQFYPVTTHFMRAVVSTLQQEGRKPYRPETFRSIELASTGTRPVEGDMMPLEVVAVVKHNLAYGRAGRQQYRGMLTEAQVSTAPNGQISMVADSQRINDAWDGFHQQFPNRLILGTPSPTPTDDAGGAAQDLRVVTSTRFSGIVVRKRTRRKKRKDPARTPEEAQNFLEQAAELVIRAQAFVQKNPTITNLVLRAAINRIAKAITGNAKAIDDAIPDIPALPEPQ